MPSVVFEDAALLVLNKPSLVPGSAAETAEGLRHLLESVNKGAREAAAERLAAGGGGARDTRSLTVVHRPDPAASGLIVFAKTKHALDFLSGQFQSKSVEQLYHAVVVVRRAQSERSAARAGGGAGAGATSSRIEAAHWPRDPGGGVPAEFAIDWWIGREATDPERMRAFRRNGGQPALSEFRLLERFGRFAFLECRLRSNRRHQLRVHLAAAGLPILNDPVYGLPEEQLLLSDFKRDYKGGGRSGRDGQGKRGREPGERPMIEQVALHASSLTLRHPDTGEPLTLTAPLPKAFEIAQRNLRKFARSSRG
ncbi:RluA family pseudouridine synthase [Cephaloticoccus primus]|uniref:RluA family pseudouridine synthase n=1 Tax=Cephaloticoccus primus TaxID=1548207 RepID=UPI001E346977|nr:RluA family pseudouridine synthase [Cephaloticoccus primus]